MTQSERPFAESWQQDRGQLLFIESTIRPDSSSQPKIYR
jgi:hypothetical protein